MLNVNNCILMLKQNACDVTKATPTSFAASARDCFLIRSKINQEIKFVVMPRNLENPLPWTSLVTKIKLRRKLIVFEIKRVGFSYLLWRESCNCTAVLPVRDCYANPKLILVKSWEIGWFKSAREDKSNFLHVWGCRNLASQFICQLDLYFLLSLQLQLISSGNFQFFFAACAVFGFHAAVSLNKIPFSWK